MLLFIVVSLSVIDVEKEVLELKLKVDNLSKSYDVVYDTTMSIYGIIGFCFFMGICYLVYWWCCKRKVIVKDNEEAYV